MLIFFAFLYTHRQLRLVQLIKISVNWSINSRKTIIDWHNLTIDYLINMFCPFSHTKLQLSLPSIYFDRAFLFIRKCPALNKVGINCCNKVMKTFYWPPHTDRMSESE